MTDSTVFIVGGDTTLGLLVALHFVRAGTQRIGVIGSDAARAQAAAHEVFAAASGIWAVPAAGDLSSVSEAHRMVSELAAALGEPDIVVSCQPDAEVVSDLVRQSMHDRDDG